MNTDYIFHFHSYLEQLRTDIEAYPSEAQLWICPEGISNSAGNLCLHLLGNLNHFIGHALGNTGYIRDRPAEFNDKHVSRKNMLERIDETGEMITLVLAAQDDVLKEYPEGLFNEAGSVHRQLLRLLAHLAYHVGQVNYHRRLLAS